MTFYKNIKCQHNTRAPATVLKVEGPSTPAHHCYVCGILTNFCHLYIRGLATLKRKFKDLFSCAVVREINPSIFYQAFRVQVRVGVKKHSKWKKVYIFVKYRIFFCHFNSILIVFKSVYR